MAKQPTQLVKARLVQARQKMSAAKLKLTTPRQSLLETILAIKGPFSAPSLIADMQSRKTECDPVTVWRNLALFEKAAIIERCDFSDSAAFYEVRMGQEHHHHHHVICVKCGKIEGVHICKVSEEQKELARRGYTQLVHKLEFQGICPQCS